MIGRRKVAVLAVVVAVTVPAGCGGSSSSSSSPTNGTRTVPPDRGSSSSSSSPTNGTRTVPQNVAAYGRQLTAIMAPLSHPPVNRYDFPTAERTLSTAIVQLSAMAPPAKLASDHGRLVTALRIQLALIPNYVAAYRAHDQAKIGPLNRANGLQQSVVRSILADMNRIASGGG
jgi:hypothetical protein